jgi:hypothetical protein
VVSTVVDDLPEPTSSSSVFARSFSRAAHITCPAIATRPCTSCNAAPSVEVITSSESSRAPSCLIVWPPARPATRRRSIMPPIAEPIACPISAVETPSTVPPSEPPIAAPAAASTSVATSGDLDPARHHPRRHVAHELGQARDRP